MMENGGNPGSNPGKGIWDMGILDVGNSEPLFIKDKY